MDNNQFRHGGEEIIKERIRQVEEEGYDAKHDDDLHNQGLLSAAKSYLIAAATMQSHDIKAQKTIMKTSPKEWKWMEIHWKPSKDPIRNLEKARALIIAEIGRLRRQNTVVYKVYPDSEKMGLADKNEVSAVFKHKKHAQTFAASMWGTHYIIETIRLSKNKNITWE